MPIKLGISSDNEKATQEDISLLLLPSESTKTNLHFEIAHSTAHSGILLIP